MDTHPSLDSTGLLNVQTPSLRHQIFDLRHFRRKPMSYYKNKQIEAEDERIVLFAEQKAILKAYIAEQKAQQEAQANMYSYTLKEFGLL